MPMNPSHYYKATPIMVDGVVYSPNAVGLLEAFNPRDGKTIWLQQPFEATMKEASGQSMRGIDSWRGRTCGFCWCAEAICMRSAPRMAVSIPTLAKKAA